MLFKRSILLLFCSIAIFGTTFANQSHNSDIIQCYDIDPSYLVSSSNHQSHSIIHPDPRRDPVGEVEQLGTTYYDYQHNGTISKMIAVDDNGGIHVAWMKGFDAQQANRRMVYCCLPPDTNEWVGPVMADNSNRAGYGHVAVLPYDGRGVVFCHSQPPPLEGDEYLSTMCVDFAPYTGAFDDTNAPTFEDAFCIHPKGSIDQNNRAHMVATENSADEQIWQRVVYWRGEATDRDFQAWEWTEVPIVLDTSSVISSISSASRQSNKVVLAWHHNRVGVELGDWDNAPGAYQRNNDIRYVILEDGEEYDPDEHEIRSLTKIHGPDPDLWDPEPDIELDPLNPDIDTTPYGDIWRPYCDIDIQFDPWEGRDELYAAFAAGVMYERPWVDDEEDIVDGMSGEMDMLWFWNSDQDTITLVANGWYSNRNNNDDVWLSRCGGWRMNADRPSIAFDPDNAGTIFVTWVSFPQIYEWNEEEQEWEVIDIEDISGDGYVNAEVMVSVSTDYGITWLEPVNVTNTRWDINDHDEGETPRSEAWQSVAVYAYDGALHLMYVQDLCAGGVPQDEGQTTNSPVFYQRVPIEDLNIDELEPIELPYEEFTFHNLPPDGIKNEANVELPLTINLSAVYPNPFNSSTIIQYQLPKSMQVSLSIFDTYGREVTNLVDGQTQAGDHHVVWNAVNQPTGIYFARIHAGGITRTKKLLLVK